MITQLAAYALLIIASEQTMAVDVDSMWDFQDPERSEQRFRTALEASTGDTALILRTQIARTYSIRGEFQEARNILEGMSADLNDSSPEAQVRYRLELGRSYASGAHRPEDTTETELAEARSLYLQAYEIAASSGLDALAIDALHMMAFVDTDPEDQLTWGNKALALARSSDDLGAQRWQASLLNNTGYALHQLGRYEEALENFQAAVVLREQGSNEVAIHVAHWMVAWTLRSLGRTDKALAIQLRLEREADAAGRPDVYVYEELAALYRDKGDEEKSAHYDQKVEQLQES